MRNVYGVLGNPIGHSLSPVMHGAAFKAAGIEAVYGTFQSVNLKGCIHGIRALGISGMSITIPFKTAVIPHLDAIDGMAREMGAVNTIVNRNGYLKGFNTDGWAAIKAIEKVVDPKGRRCIIVGAGGAARGIGYMARKKGMHVTVVNRGEERGSKLANFLECEFVPLSKIYDVDGDVIIQTTPVGMFPSADISPVPENVFHHGMVAMDAIYNPLETRFLKNAAARGCITVSGLEMFVLQGAEQFRLWTGLKPPTDVMRHVVKKALEEES